MNSGMEQLSRPASVTPWGKCDTRVQTLIPEVAAADLRCKAAAAGVSESELVRNLVLRHLYGDEAVEASLIAQYRSMVGTDSRIRLPVKGEVRA